MTEIQPSGVSRPQQPLYAPQQTDRQAAEQKQSSPKLTQVNLGRPGISDNGEESLRIARRLSEKTLSGIEEAQGALQEIGELWRAGKASADTLRAPASRILEAAGSSYQGIQPLMQDRQLQIGSYQVKGFELVGAQGVIPMDALLPNSEAPQAINQAWPQLESARQEAYSQQQRIDLQAAEALPEGPPPSAPAPSAGVHRLPPQGRILELLS